MDVIRNLFWACIFSAAVLVIMAYAMTVLT